MANGNTVARPKRARKVNPPTTPDPIEIAMAAEATGRAPEGAAQRVLDRQARLIGWQIASERAAFALRTLTVVVGLGAVLGLALMAWSASRDESIVVQPFNAPPAYAQRGLDGQVLAQRFTDEIVAIRSQSALGFLATPDLRGATDEIRIQIPQTGVSLGEVQRLLTLWLGRQKKISGALSEDSPGLVTLTVRVEGHPAVRLQGAPAQLDDLIRQAAERSFAVADPLQWVLALRFSGRRGEALAASRAYARAIGREHPDSGVAYAFWAFDEPDLYVQLRLAGETVATHPTLMTARRILAETYVELGQEGAAFETAQAALALRDRDQPRRYSARGRLQMRADSMVRTATLRGDYASILDFPRAGPASRARAAARGHDGQNARRLVRNGQDDGSIDPIQAALVAVSTAEATRDWPAMSVALDTQATARADWLAAPAGPGQPPRSEVVDFRVQAASEAARVTGPLRAIALARTGRVEQARAVAAATPLDCAPCLRARAEVESAAKNWTAADAWYAKAAVLGPQLPLTETVWGASLFARGDAKAAILKLSSAAAKGPRYADPLELWGEALLIEGDAKGAAGKFAQAAKFAPRWGRLHLKWGQALAKLGKADEARTKWRAAATMDLTAAERAELAAVSRDQAL